NATPDFRLISCDHNDGIIQRDHRRLALDSGGWAKGLAADQAVAAALGAGARSAQVNCGFDIVRHGESAWECLIRHPRRSFRDVAVRCRHHYRAVATSANTETWRAGSNAHRYGHLMDPRTGAPAQSDLDSVTVFADDGFMADALASALFVMGQDDAIRWLRLHPDVGAVLIPTEWNDEIGTLQVFGRIEANKAVGS
ncbi:MAG: hypothetical protein GF341_01425, partial [candidate division Zixibacteria bacterium]|nr:hypothetical protein [candidate division Zixibacteria bacterium]